MNTHSQRGGTFFGFLMGLVIGLGLSLAVAVYVTKVPTPFSNKNQPRSSEQDSAESQKNKDWNPNNVLQPKAPAEVPMPSTNSSDGQNKSAEHLMAEPSKVDNAPAVTADPLGDLAKSKPGFSMPAPSTSGPVPFDYVVQVGAFRSLSEADALKAKLAMMGLDAKVSEREQGGRTVYRVRLGPFDNKTVAEKTSTSLEGNGIENTLIRVQR